jgi:hypothetical protein
MFIPIMSTAQVNNVFSPCVVGQLKEGCGQLAGLKRTFILPSLQLLGLRAAPRGSHLLLRHVVEQKLSTAVGIEGVGQLLGQRKVSVCKERNQLVVKTGYVFSCLFVSIK